MELRATTWDDLSDVMQLYADAREFMKKNGNADQWKEGYPKRELIESDLQKGASFVCVDDGVVVGTFYFACEEEPTYNKIYEGTWLNEELYAVVHRITSNMKGVATFCLEWCFSKAGNLRIDTHEDNIPMQRLLSKQGFTLCGRIHLENGDERLAYQKIKKS